jgi:hypothetical protein
MVLISWWFLLVGDFGSFEPADAAHPSGTFGSSLSEMLSQGEAGEAPMDGIGTFPIVEQ